MLLVCISLFFGVIIAFMYAGYKWIQAGERKGKHQIDDTYIRYSREVEYTKGKYSVSSQGGKLIINFPEKMYINKLTFEYASEFFSDCSLDIEKENIYGVVENLSIQDKLMKDMPRSVVNIGGIVSKIEINFNESHNDFKIWNVGVDNSFKFNPLITIFWSSAIFLLGFGIIFKKENARMPAFATLVIILVSSICLLLVEPPYIVGWDEQIHYKNAYMLGVSEKGEATTQVEEYMYGYPFLINTFSQPAQESVEERLDFVRVLNDKMKNPGIFIDDYELSFASFGYVFQALVLKLGNILHVPFYISWLMGKFSNVLLYAVIMCIAVHIVPVGKRVLMVFSMMPTMIFQSTTYTYDITVIAFIILATCVLIKEFLSPDSVFRYRWRLLFFASIFLGCLPKAVYAPIMLGGLFVERSKFYSEKDRKCFRVLIILGFIALIMSFALPALISPEQIGDARGGDTSGVGQMHYVIGQPVSYAVILIKNVFASLESCLYGATLCHFSYLGIGQMSATATILLVSVILTDKYYDGVLTRKSLPVKMKIGMLFLIALVIALIWTALYLDFTEVGKSVISGVQARYYLPFLFLFYMCFQTDKIQNCFSKERYQLTIMMISSALLFHQIWQLVLVKKCL
jgi:Predicted membrane protein